MPTWLLIALIGGIAAIGVVLYFVLTGEEEEEKQEKGELVKINWDLNNLKTRVQLVKDGLPVSVGETQHLKIADGGKKGYSWIANEECNEFLKMDVSTDHPMMKPKKEGDKKEGDKKPPKAEKKEGDVAKKPVPFADK